MQVRVLLGEPILSGDVIAEIVLPICGTILVAVISVSLSYYFSSRAHTNSQWRSEKVNHYGMLLSSLSDLAVDGTVKRKANELFSLATNTIALVAPQSVVSALMAFHNEVRYSKSGQLGKTP